MTAEVIELKPRNPGNGTREALMDIVRSCNGEEIASDWADWILIELAMRGFMVVPIEEVTG